MPHKTPVIDAHQHFWAFSAAEYGWIDPGSVLERDYLPADLLPLLERAGVDGCIAVQARQSESETDWLLGLARSDDWIRGVVGWADLRADDLPARLDRWRGEARLVGFRHIVQGETEPGFLLRKDFVGGVRTLLARGYAYDILIRAHQAADVPVFAESVGEGRLILDHGAKPDILGGGWEPWASDMARIARHRGIWCKISGLVTEADHQHWRADDIARYLDHLLHVFGPERLIFGSDWPVCTLAADYDRVHELIDRFVDRACPEHRDAIFGGNALAAYALSA